MASIAEMVSGIQAAIDQCDVVAGAVRSCVDQTGDTRNSVASVSEGQEEAFALGRSLSSEIKVALAQIAEALETLQAVAEKTQTTSASIGTVAEECGRLTSESQELHTLLGRTTVECVDLEEKIHTAFTLSGGTGDAVKQQAGVVRKGITDAGEHAEAIHDSAETTHRQYLLAQQKVAEEVSAVVQSVRDSLDTARGQLIGALEQVTEAVGQVATTKAAIDSINVDLSLMEDETEDHLGTVHGIQNAMEEYIGPFRAML